MHVQPNRPAKLAAVFFITAIFLTGLFTPGMALGAKIDEQLLKWDAAYYKKLADKLNGSNATSDEFLLQKTLLQRLIYFSTKKADEKIDIGSPVNQDQYLDLVSNFVSWSQSRTELLAKIKETRDKLKVLQRQIELLPDTAPNILTLQLQYAFYKKSLEVYHARFFALSKAMEQTPKVLVDALKNISLDHSKLRKALDRNKVSLDKVDDQIQALRIEEERLSLLQKNDRLSRLKTAVNKLQDQRQQLVKERLKILFLKFSSELKAKNKDAFKTGSQILELASSLNSGSGLNNDLAQLLHTMESLVFGKASTFNAQTLQEIRLLAVRFYRTINAPIFSIDGTPVSIFKLLLAFLVFVLGFIVGGIYKSNIKRISLASRTFTPATRTLLANLGYYAIVFVGFLVGLRVVGIDLSSFALLAGALTVGIGFGLQNIVANFVSGIILMFERSVKIGDYIEFDEKLRGRIVDLRMRSMTINTNSNIDVIVPNQDFIQNRVINWTMKDDIRRFDIPFGVAYGADPAHVAEVVLEAVKSCDYQNLYTTPTRKAKVIMTGMGDSSLDFSLRIWIKGRDIMRPNRVKSRFLVLLYKALYEAGIEIPFPQRDIHLRSIEKEILLSMSKVKTVGDEEAPVVNANSAGHEDSRRSVPAEI